MKKTLRVRAATLADPALCGLAKVPLEGAGGQRFITEDKAVEVPCTAYYLRCLAFGELVEVEQEHHRPAHLAEEE